MFPFPRFPKFYTQLWRQTGQTDGCVQSGRGELGAEVQVNNIPCSLQSATDAELLFLGLQRGKGGKVSG